LFLTTLPSQYLTTLKLFSVFYTTLFLLTKNAIKENLTGFRNLLGLGFTKKAPTVNVGAFELLF